MLGRPLMVATLLGASIGVPYAVSHSTSPKSPNPGATPAPAAMSSFFSPAPFNAGPPAPSARFTAGPIASAPGLLASDVPSAKGETQFHSLQEVLRFDVTREWVYANWTRKSTGLGDPEMFGIRVALVTGTGRADLAGSLTYQFNPQGQVQHISLRGRTADTTPIVNLVTTTYGLTRAEALPGEQLYQLGSGSKVSSELRTRAESVLWANVPNTSFVVELELERPGSGRYLPSRGPQFQIPQVAAAPPPPAPPATAAQTAQNAGDSAKNASNAAAEPALIGKMRSATQQEEGQVLWKRWPN